MLLGNSTNLGIPCVYSTDLAVIAQAYAEIQDARHIADYDVVDAKGTIGLLGASDSLDKAKLAFDAWSRVRYTDEARLFLATLIPVSSGRTALSHCRKSSKQEA